MVWLSKYPKVVTESETSVPLLSIIGRLLTYLWHRKEMQSLFILTEVNNLWQNNEIMLHLMENEIFQLGATLGIPCVGVLLMK